MPAAPSDSAAPAAESPAAGTPLVNPSAIPDQPGGAKPWNSDSFISDPARNHTAVPQPQEYAATPAPSQVAAIDEAPKSPLPAAVEAAPRSVAANPPAASVTPNPAESAAPAASAAPVESAAPVAESSASPISTESAAPGVTEASDARSVEIPTAVAPTPVQSLEPIKRRYAEAEPAQPTPDLAASLSTPASP